MFERQDRQDEVPAMDGPGVYAYFADSHCGKGARRKHSSLGGLA